jgi:hypothetical protein
MLATGQNTEEEATERKDVDGWRQYQSTTTSDDDRLLPM